MHPIVPRDITAPRSRHNRHITRKEDLEPVGSWSRDQLYEAVERADAEERLVVLDYSRERLYLARATDLTYVPPRILGLAADPALRVSDPGVFDPETGAVEPTVSVTVAPKFDILVPAFDWETADDWEPPRPRRQESPTGTPTGSAVGG